MGNQGKRFKGSRRALLENRSEDISTVADHRNSNITTHYIADLAQELRDMAGRAHMPFLAYLLDLATEEAKSQLDREQGGQ